MAQVLRQHTTTAHAIQKIYSDRQLRSRSWAAVTTSILKRCASGGVADSWKMNAWVLSSQAQPPYRTLRWS